MKVSPEHREAIARAIRPFDTAETRARYVARDIPRADTVRDIDRRYRWDLLWAAVDSGRASYAMIRDYKDAHVDTVLRQCVAPLEAVTA